MKKKIFLSIIFILIAVFGFACKSNADTIRLGPRYDGLWHYKLNEYTNMNLFCAQEGGRLSSHYANTYTVHEWSNVSSVFKSENDYKKITWIKNHIWEQTDKNLYSYEEILSILKKSGKNVSMEDVTTVYGSQNNKFKVYQLISWRYTNGYYVNPSNYLSGSLKTVYDAIVKLAEKNYNNNSNGQDALNITLDENNPVKGNGELTWNFTVTTNNPVELITLVYENGNDISSVENRVSVTRKGNKLAVKVSGYDENKDNSYQIIVKQPQVIAKGKIYTHSKTQNMILINTERTEIVVPFTDTVEGASGQFGVKINKTDGKTGKVPGIKFNVTGSIQLTGQATDSNGELQIVPNGTKIEPGQEFNYVITEVEDESSNYVALKEPIKVKLISGTGKDSNGKKYYCITYAKFLSGKTKEKVKLVNGKEANIEITNSTTNSENAGTSTITITVENPEKEFDLALTKTIKKVSYSYLYSLPLYDTTHEAYINLPEEDKKNANSNIILKINSYLSLVGSTIFEEIGINSEDYEEDHNKILQDISNWGTQECTNQEAINKYVPADKRDESIKKFDVFIYALRQKDIPILTPEGLTNNGIDASNIYDAIDRDMNGEITADDAYTNLKDSESTSQQNEYDRLNDIDISNLNKNGNTTAIYNLDKSPIEITKEGQIYYEITVYNEGDIDAKNIEITDYIPVGLSVIDAEGKVYTSGTVTYNISDYSITWNITENSDGSKTATTTILTESDEKLECYKEDDLKSISVGIFCQVDNTAETGKCYYNVAEITAARPVTTSKDDRDSQPENLGDYNNVNQLIDKYSNNYEEKFENQNKTKSNKNEYNYQDDDDFEVILVRDKKFDLALRKSITKVGTSLESMKDVTYNIIDDNGNEKVINRLPKITADSSYWCLVRGTGEYYHKKEAVPVNANDYVEYTIRVYNEGSFGDYAGYASQITDYLPQGLEFYAIVNQDGTWTTLESDNTAEQADNTNRIGKFKATYDSSNNKVQLDYIDGDYNIITPQQALMRIYGRASLGVKDVTYYTQELNDETGTRVTKDNYTYQEVKIVCKVKDNVIQDDATTKNYLTNLAAITQEKVSTREGVVVSSEDTVLDTDSTPSQINIGNEYDKQNQKVNLKTYYTTDCNNSTGVNDAFIEYYEGIEDDDDFETVVLNQIEIGVEKVDEQENPIPGIEFSAQPVPNTNVDPNEAVFYKNPDSITDGEGKTWLAIVNMPKTRIEKPYYEMEFQENANTSYITMQDKFYIRFYYDCDENNNINGIEYIEVYLNDSNGELLTLNEANDYQGSIEVTMTDGTKEESTVTWNGNKLMFKVVNKKITTESGTYNVKLVKKGTDGSQLGGVLFTANAVINGENKILNGENNPLQTNATNAIQVGSVVTIDKDKVGTPDTYTLKEYNIGDNTGYYIGITQDIVLTVKKESTTNADGSTITNSVTGIELAVQGANVTKESETKSIATLSNGSKVTVEYERNTKTITIIVENPERAGTFDIDLVKYVQGTKVPLANAGFTVSVKDEQGTELADTTKTYTTGDNGHFTEKVTVPIADAGKKYTITVKETKVPTGYEGIAGDIVYKDVESIQSTDGYVLKANESTTVTNAKKVVVSQSEVLIEAENIPERPHKGVKEVENQDSGYYDEVTGAVYTNEESLESTLHDWVITTKIPSGISKYETYLLTDPIDERLVFSGLDKVKVKYKDGENLTLNKDYKLDYNVTTRTLSIIFINSDFGGGRTLQEGKTVEVRFNTTFAKDENGNIIAINQKVENQATLVYGNGCELKTEKPEVHTGGVGLYKYDEKTGEALEGAKFKIATSKENAEKGIFVKDANGNDIEKITNEKGIAIFEGLEFGEDAINKVKETTKDPITGADVYTYNWEKVQTTYYLVETKSPEGYSKIEEPIEAIVKKDNYDINDIESLIKVGNSPDIFDLALRKFITGVTNGHDDKQEVTTRIPVFKIDENGNYVYEHTKEPVLVANQNVVEYTIRVYNEGTVNGYAKEIKDDIPEGLEFLPDDELNKEYRWIMLDEEGNETDNVNEAKYIVTDYLSKENEETDGENLLKAFDEEAYEAGSIKEPDYKEVKVAFKVTMPNTSDEIIINQAQISDDSDEDGNEVTDKDSTPNEWIDGEDDQDIEKIKVQYFDLALRKWVTKAIVIENGVETITETGHKAEDDPEAVVKVDLKKSKLDKVVVKFEYQIRVTNEGEIAGSVEEISDYIPQGLKFVAADNPEWEEKEGKVVTDQLAGQIIEPGESKEVTILLTWINREDNMGLKINVAEISKDYNEYGTPDIDSTPNNQVPGEDDIDDAPVILTITTGQTVVYIGITIATLAIIAGGAIGIKKYVIK